VGWALPWSGRWQDPGLLAARRGAGSGVLEGGKYTRVSHQPGAETREVRLGAFYAPHPRYGSVQRW